MGTNRVHALRGIDLTVARGKLVAITGPPGSGRSTFLNLLGCLDRPAACQYWLDDIAVGRLSTGQLAMVCNRKIGFVTPLTAWQVDVRHAGILVIPQWPADRIAREVDAFLQQGLPISNELYHWKPSVGWARRP